jgi:dTMP kinase
LDKGQQDTRREKARRGLKVGIRMKKGLLIAIEGQDGVGTTSVSKMLYDRLVNTIPVSLTQEPSTGPIGRRIRQILGKNFKKIPARAMELLFRADRVDHDRTLIRPYIRKGITVITDRHYVSTLVYQVAAKVDWELGEEEPRFNVLDEMGKMYDAFRLRDEIMIPDLTLLLRVSEGERIQRMRKRGQEEELYESALFQKKVAILYELWFQSPRFEHGCRELVNAEKSLEDVTTTCFSKIKKIFDGV